MEQRTSPRPQKHVKKRARKDLRFPEHYHLNVTTENRVHAWFSSGVREAFASRDGGIVTTIEAKDGSGILAIADSHIVVLHDAKGLAHQRYKLKGKDVGVKPFLGIECCLITSQGQVRVLGFANDSKDIFSTSLQDTVLRYSIAQDRLTDFSCRHPSPPTIVAVSLQSVYLISASRTPPVIYLQELSSGCTPVHLKPQASNAYVTVAAFHPQREDIFLLAYADSTLSIHNASRIMFTRADARDGSIGLFKRGHQITNAQIEARRNSASPGARGVGITAASFIPGHSLRVVSVAGDGKCRIVDFEFGLNVLRTWHVHAACTCLSVFTTAETLQKSTGIVGGSDVALKRSKGRLYGHIIAIGRVDGFVVLYDDLGLLRGERLLHLTRGPIINVEWIPNEKQEPWMLEGSLRPVNPASATKGTDVVAHEADHGSQFGALQGGKHIAASKEPVAPRVDAQLTSTPAFYKYPGAITETDVASTGSPPKGSLLESLKRSPIKVAPRKQSLHYVIPLPLSKTPSMYYPMPGAWLSRSS